MTLCYLEAGIVVDLDSMAEQTSWAGDGLAPGDGENSQNIELLKAPLLNLTLEDQYSSLSLSVNTPGN